MDESVGRGSYLICFGGVDHCRSQEGKKRNCFMGWCQYFPKNKDADKQIGVRGQQPSSGSLGMKSSAYNFAKKTQKKKHGSKHPGDACKLGTPKVEKNPTKNDSFGSSNRQPSDFFLVF